MRVLLSNLIRRRNRRTILFLFLILLSSTAHARVYIQVDQVSEKKFPIAIENLSATDDRESREWNHTIPDKIRKDLGLCGLFEIVPEEEYPKTPGARSIDPAQIQFPPWSLIGAQALVKGGYSKQKGGVRVTLSLYDPVLGQRLLSRDYTTSDKEASLVAHHFADEVMRELTGEAGVFSTKIAYVQSIKKGKEIGVMDMDGEGAHTITSNKGFALSQAWSPDGSQIAYTTLAIGKDPEIAIVGSGGGPSKMITSNKTVNVSPTWSPSGILTIASAMGGDTEIYLLNKTGDVLKKLTDSFGIDVNPSWSPDGSAFVFASERAGRLHLFKANATGGNIERLTFVGVQNDNPAWSPKGDKIVFQSLEGNWDLFIMNADGSQLQRLTSSAGNNESPTWAPNGRFIAYSTTRTGKSQIVLMREDGSNQTTLEPEGVLQPAWGPWVK